MKSRDAMEVLENIEDGELSDAFWNTMLITNLDSSIRTNPQYNVYLMSKVKDNTKGFLSKNITIKNMIEDRGDTHHIFPKNYLQRNGFNNRGWYNQLANYVYTQSEINIAISNKSPNKYFETVINQCIGDKELTCVGIGGHLFLGIKDDGTIMGVNEKLIGKLKKEFITSINNPIKINPAFYLKIDEIEIGNKKILYIFIPESSQVHRCNGKIYDRNDIRVNLIHIYERLMQFIAKHLNDKFYLEGDQRVSLRDKIYREAITNLLIHREFANPFPAKLIIEKNRVYIENGNRAHGNGIIDPENFSPFPKNPAIAKFLKR